jgi:hypothetical protein
MSITIGIQEWSDFNDDVLRAIQEHARRKAAEAINWQEWMKIKHDDGGRWGDIPRDLGGVISDLIKNFCGDTGNDYDDFYIVPYPFD